MTRTSLPESTTPAPSDPAPQPPSRLGVELTRVGRGLRRRAGRARRWARVTFRREAARAVHAWRSSLQVRIGAITMLVAGTVVVIVSLVLFSQIRDQLLSVKRQAAIQQAQAGVAYAQSQVSGIATGDAASVRTTLIRTVNALLQRGGAAGDFEVVMVHRVGDIERPAYRQRLVYDGLPKELRADVAAGGQSWQYAPLLDEDDEPQPTFLVGAAVPSDAAGSQQIELYYAFPLE
jgi:two-component system, OmpR family, sensor histidine kinase MtrB